MYIHERLGTQPKVLFRYRLINSLLNLGLVWLFPSLQYLGIELSSFCCTHAGHCGKRTDRYSLLNAIYLQVLHILLVL